MCNYVWPNDFRVSSSTKALNERGCKRLGELLPAGVGVCSYTHQITARGFYGDCYHVNITFLPTQVSDI